MLRQTVLILLFVIFTARAVLAADPAKVGLFLSFEQRLALSYALLAQGEPEAKKEDIVKRAKAYFKGMLKQPVQTVVVGNFNEFLKSMRGDWPNTHSLALDMEILEKAGPRALKVYTSPSERVQRQIQQYMIWQQTQLLEMAAHEKETLGLASKHFGDALKSVANNPLPVAKKVAETWLLNESEAVLADRMKELDRVGEKIAESSFAKQQDPAARIFMQTLLSQYFSRLHMSSKKLIVSSFLGGDLVVDDIKKFEIMVQNSGPVLQKLLQVVARQANLPKEVLQVFRNLENSVRPVPWVLVKDIVENEKKNFDFSYFEHKHLGVGTIAQTHRAQVNVNGQRLNVVPRFIKPGMEDRVAEDKEIMTEVGKILDNHPDFIKMQVPKISPVIEDIISTVTAEFDQNETIERQKKAQVYQRVLPFNTPEYKTEIQFQVPKILEPNSKSDLMVQEMVFGTKLDKAAETYAAAIPGLKKTIVEAMARVWAQEALFGSGFYHSDLHQGNFMIDVKEPRIIVNILDFGMGGTISNEMQRQVMVLGVGTDILSSELIARSFWELSNKSKNGVEENDFKKAVQEKVQSIRAGKEPNISMELWMAWALNRNLALPYEFVSLNRGMAIVNKLLEDSGSKLDLTKITKSLAKENPLVVYKNLVVKERLSMEELAKLGWSEMRSLFQKEPTKLRTLQMPDMAAPLSCRAVLN